jgi:predicted N-acetyltransferase YhbS
MIRIRRTDAPDLDAVIACYRACTLGGRRPIADRAAVQRMFAHANVILLAEDGDQVVGVARAWSDFAHVTYLADLAVRESHQRHGLGRRLIQHLRGATPGTLQVLIAAPQAHDYYGRIGYAQHRSAWVLRHDQQLEALPPVAP